MKKKMRILIIVLSVIALIAAGTGVALFMSGDYYSDSKKLKNGHLWKYTYSSGGDMRGSHYSQVISRYDDDKALLSIFSSEWYADDGKVEEYLISADVLKEIESVFRSNHLRRWENRNISKMFVADGATYSYRFYIGDADFGFSSQYFTGHYKDVISRLNEVINKYSEDKEPFPGLVLPERDESEDEGYNGDKPVPGELTFEVYSYRCGEVYCRLLNGTDESVTFSDSFSIFDAETEKQIPTSNPYPGDYTVSPGEVCEKKAKPDEFLFPGRYRIVSGDFACEFEIR